MNLLAYSIKSGESVPGGEINGAHKHLFGIREGRSSDGDAVMVDT